MKLFLRNRLQALLVLTLVLGLAPVVLAQTKPTLMSSVTFLADHFHEVPVHIVPCMEGRDGFAALGPECGPPTFYGSILPAMWSLMLALRARGLGSCWTTGHLHREREMAELLGIPFEHFTQVGLFPVAYTVGTQFARAWRRPVADVLCWNRYSGTGGS